MILETKRLLLRSFNEKDLEDLFEYLSQLKVHCFLDMKPRDIESAKSLLSERIKDSECFAVVLKENNKVIGEISALEGDPSLGKEYENAFSPCWILNEDYQHKGYMYEALTCYFDYLFNKRNARRIYAYTEDYNVASQNLCLHLGMRKEAEFKEFVHFVDDENGNPIYENTLVFAILKKEWVSK